MLETVGYLKKMTDSLNKNFASLIDTHFFANLAKDFQFFWNSAEELLLYALE